MKKRLDNDQGFLKEKFADYRVDPPAEIWASISGQLGRGSRRRMFVVIIAAAATIALAVTLGITLLGPGDTAVTSEVDGSDMADKGPVMASKRSDTFEESGTEGVTHSAGDRSQLAAGGVIKEDAGEPIRVPSDGTRLARAVTGRTVVKSARFQPAPGPVRDEISAKEVLAWITQKGETANEVEETAFPAGKTATMEGEAATDHPDAHGEYLPEEEVGEKDHRWTLAAILSPQYSYRDAENQAASGIPVRETGLLTYAGGINISYSPASRLAIESGVFYNRMGLEVNGSRLSAVESFIDMDPLSSADALPHLVSVSNTVGNIVTKSGGIYVNNYMLNSRKQADVFNSSPYLFSDQGIRQQLDYLEVPFNLRYTLIDKDLEIQLVGGVSTNLLINSHVIIETANGGSQVGYLTNIRNMNYTGNAGLGMIYHIAGNFSLRLEPRFRYFLHSINDPSLPSTRPYAFGLFTGMSYLF